MPFKKAAESPIQTTLIIVLLGVIAFFGTLITKNLLFKIPESPQRMIAFEPGRDLKNDELIGRTLTTPFDSKSITGNYLASRFAQRRYDWQSAYKNLERVMNVHNNNHDFKKRAMVLAMGAGEAGNAFSIARDMLKHENDDDLALAYMFLSIEAISNQNFEQADNYLEKMPQGSLTSFVTPLLISWSQAAQGQLKVDHLGDNGIHLYHGLLVAHYLKDNGAVQAQLKKNLSASEITTEHLERLADFMTHMQEHERALKIYKQIQKIAPSDISIKEKLEALRVNPSAIFFEAPQSVEKAASYVLYDMARLLLHDKSDDSALIFSQLALYLNPTLVDARIILARIKAKNERFNEAISIYKDIPKDHMLFIESGREIAKLMYESGQIQASLLHLEELYEQTHDLETIIQIGDVYRQEKNYIEAKKAYDQALKKLGNDIPRQYWFLYYTRGMVFERLDQWNKAEQDLQTALSKNPNNPFVMNYLAYGWADQGIHLDKALNMLRKAVSLQPNDGYIIDSLGWTLYRMGQYQEAIKHLEKAVSLLPYDAVLNDHLGDAYWQVGRHLEAKFQWQRAINHAKDDEADLVADLSEKIDYGIPLKPATIENNSMLSEASKDKAESL